MPVLTERHGFFTREAANNGIPFNEVPGSSGAGVTTAVWFASCSGFPPSASAILQMFPGGEIVNDADFLGVIGGSITYTVEAGTDFLEYGTTAPDADVEFDDGFDAQAFRAALASDPDEGSDLIEYTFQILQLDPNEPIDWPGPTLPEQVENIQFSDIQFDEGEEIGSATISFDWDGEEEIDGFLIEFSVDEVNYEVDSAVKHVPGQTHYQTKTWTFEAPITYCIRIRTFRFGDLALGIPTDCHDLEFPADGPDINHTMQGGIDLGGAAEIELEGNNVNMTMSGGMDLGGAATIILGADPSGLYTLVPGKRNDTLYLREGDETTEDVKIPDPFVKLGIT